MDGLRRQRTIFTSCLDRRGRAESPRYHTYLPHVDSVYTHRSWQRYKKNPNPFNANYWECRLKELAPGTKKSVDPNKKKQKRVARERDQCGVKIKVMEYFRRAVLQSGNIALHSTGDLPPRSPPQTQVDPPNQIAQTAVAKFIATDLHIMPLLSAGGVSIAQASAASQRIYTNQRVFPWKCSRCGGNYTGDA